MSSQGSVTRWVSLLRVGDERAAQEIWARYFESLVGLARQKLASRPRRAADEEDVALSALGRFFQGVRDPTRFPDLHNRECLWKVLVRLTADKARDHIKHEARQKRGGGKVLDEAALAGASDEDQALARIISEEPTPELAARFTDLHARLLAALGDEHQLRSVAQMHLDGRSNKEIARALDCTERTVQRKLQTIEQLWRQWAREQ